MLQFNPKSCPPAPDHWSTSLQSFYNQLLKAFELAQDSKTSLEKCNRDWNQSWERLTDTKTKLHDLNEYAECIRFFSRGWDIDAATCSVKPVHLDASCNDAAIFLVQSLCHRFGFFSDENVIMDARWDVFVGQNWEQWDLAVKTHIIECEWLNSILWPDRGMILYDTFELGKVINMDPKNLRDYPCWPAGLNKGPANSSHEMWDYGTFESILASNSFQDCIFLDVHWASTGTAKGTRDWVDQVLLYQMNHFSDSGGVGLEVDQKHLIHTLSSLMRMGSKHTKDWVSHQFQTNDATLHPSSNVLAWSGLLDWKFLVQVEAQLDVLKPSNTSVTKKSNKKVDFFKYHKNFKSNEVAETCQQFNSLWANFLLDIEVKKRSGLINEAEILAYAKDFIRGYWWGASFYPPFLIAQQIWNAWRSQLSPEMWEAVESDVEKNWAVHLNIPVPTKVVRLDGLKDSSMQHLSLSLDWARCASIPSTPACIQEYYVMAPILKDWDTYSFVDVNSRLEDRSLIGVDEMGESKEWPGSLENHFEKVSVILDWLQDRDPISLEAIERLEATLEFVEKENSFEASVISRWLRQCNAYCKKLYMNKMLLDEGKNDGIGPMNKKLRL